MLWVCRKQAPSGHLRSGRRTLTAPHIKTVPLFQPNCEGISASAFFRLTIWIQWDHSDFERCYLFTLLDLARGRGHKNRTFAFTRGIKLVHGVSDAFHLDLFQILDK